MYIIRGKCFGYFIVSSYFIPFIVALLLVQVPTPSLLAVAMILVRYPYFLADPLRPPTLPLLVVIAFFVQYIFWRCRGEAIASIFLALWDSVWVDIPFVGRPAAASSWTRSAALSW